MGLVSRGENNSVQSLPRRCVVGRGALAQLRLQDDRVSSEHATIYFDDGWWKVRDLGSRNGTFVNGERLSEGRSRSLARGDEVAFGRSEPNLTCRLLSAAPPGPAARDEHLNYAEAAGDTLWLPNSEAPEACITYRTEGWLCVDAEGSRIVSQGSVVVVAGRKWTLFLPARHGEPEICTSTTRDMGGDHELQLEFSASLDQEHVSLVVRASGKRINLGGRTFNQALLALARQRLEDEAAGVPIEEVGWVYSDDLRAELLLDRKGLNLQLWRATQDFTKLALPAEFLIQRRLDTHQLRIGFKCQLKASKVQGRLVR